MLDQLTTIAELIGAAGVILSLIYVGKQLKQTNSISRSNVHWARSDGMVGWATSVACTPDLCETLAKVHYHNLVRDSATEAERMQLGYLLSGLVGQIHMSFEQWKEGIITKAELEGFYGPATAVLAQPYIASAWPVLRHGFPADFQEWFERRDEISKQDSAGATQN